MPKLYHVNPDKSLLPIVGSGGGSGTVQTVNNISPGADLNVQLTHYVTQATFDALVASNSLIPGASYIITDAVSLETSIIAEGQYILPTTQRRGFILKASTRLSVNGMNYNVTSTQTYSDVTTLLDTGATLTPGRDYYIYLTYNAGFAIKVSLNATYPQGYTADNSRKIGGFHTLCVSAGTLPDFNGGGQSLPHPLSGFVAGDILPASFWDLKHRPKFAQPEGMVYDDWSNVGVDIYLASGTGINTKSVYQGTITRNRQCIDMTEDILSVRKKLLTHGEFLTSAEGSNQMTACAGTGTDPSGATTGGGGGRLDTAGRRMLSRIGCEEMCGSIGQIIGNASSGGYITGTSTATVFGQISTTPTYGQLPSDGPNGQAGSKGSLGAIVGQLLAGGAGNSGSGCGSRARAGYNYLSAAYESTAVRGCADSI